MLEVLASAVENQRQSKVPEPSRQGILFVRKGEGAKQKSARKVMPMVSSHDNWKMLADPQNPLFFPPQIAVNSLHPDLLLWTVGSKTVLLAELTVPSESNMKWAYERKMVRYADLKSQCQDRGWTCHVYPVEVGCRGFAGRSVIGFLPDIGVALKARRSVLRWLQETAESASVWKWRSCDRSD